MSGGNADNEVSEWQALPAYMDGQRSMDFFLSEEQ